MDSAFKKHDILNLAKEIEKKKLCNNCFGRQFARVSTGMTNRERGELLRKMIKSAEPERCTMCNNLFRNLEVYADKAIKKLKLIDFKTFVVGSKLSSELIKNEENLWEDIGIEHCEPIKSEINREIGKLIESKTGCKFKKENQDVLIIFDFEKGSVNIKINPIFIIGKYKKFVRNISQSKWKKYKESVESIVAKPILKVTKAEDTAFHGAGREDVDARCLDWRPFAIEIINPKKRGIKLPDIIREINRTKKVAVSGLHFGTKNDIRNIKKMRADKTYRVTIEFENPVENAEKLKGLVGMTKQKTPTRVLHRRADKMRKRKVKSLKWKKIGSRKMQLEVRGEAGFYAKEFVTGDNERTKPSVAEVLKNPAKVLELDVIKIHPERRK